jgi:hypothetical protein
LFPHQADFLKAYCKDNDKNFIVTTATGSGKSLCFLAYVFDQLTKDKNATALLCFPTQALMWGQAERFVRLSDKKTLAYPGGQSTAYGGTIKVGKEAIGWTIWHGLGHGATFDRVMDAKFPRNGGHSDKGVNYPWEVRKCRSRDASTPASSSSQP